MPLNNAAAPRSPPSSRQSPRQNAVFMMAMAMVACMHLGIALIQRPFDLRMQMVICGDHYNNRHDTRLADPKCWTENVQNKYEHFNFLSQIFQALGGLLVAPTICSLTDSERPFTIMATSSLWYVCCMFINLMGHSMSQPVQLFLLAIAGAVRFAAEGTVFALVTSVSTDHTRSMNYASTICSALVGYLTGELVARTCVVHLLYIPEILGICAFIIANTITGMIYLNTARPREEIDQRSSNRAARGTVALRPIFQKPTSFLLLIVAFVMPLAISAAAAADNFVPTRFFSSNADTAAAASISSSAIFATVSFWFRLGALVTLGVFVRGLATCFGDGTVRPVLRDRTVLSVSFINLLLGSTLLIIRGRTILIVGLVFLTLGAGAASSSLGLLISLIGPGMRCARSGCVWGTIVLSQCAATILIALLMNTASGGHRVSRGPFWVLFGSVLFIYLFTMRFYFTKMEPENPPPADGDVELQNMGNGGGQQHAAASQSPQQPPPTYTAVV